MCEVGVHRQSLAYAQLLHDDETQTVNEAVRLIPVALEILKRGPLFVRRRPVNAREFLTIEPAAKLRRLFVADLSRERDCLGYDMVRRQKVVG
jgi:hypothetical protein